MKICLILVDGMRPDGVKNCNHPFVKELEEKSFHSFSAKTVVPPVTMPCHFSLFTSVPPKRHGILTNTYVPMARPVTSLIDLLADEKKRCAMFYNYENLRDLSSPGKLHKSSFTKINESFNSDQIPAKEALSYIEEYSPDFTFLYLGDTDEVGHEYGWMSKEYMNCLYKAFDIIENFVKKLPEDFTVFITADHGGHEFNHGDEIPEDMLIPLFIKTSENLETTEEFENPSIMDIAPTIAKLLGVNPDPVWKGKSLL